jgi:DNA polymerase-3 subunit delta'
MRSHADIEAPLPWQQGCWESICRARAAGRFPHALLVTGPVGVGKRLFVTSIACSLLCSQPDARGLACGRCRECELLAAGTHPDYVAVGPDPEGKSDEIKVDAIRRLSETDTLTAHRGGYKVMVLDPAQNINQSAANSLLKTLEEPCPGTFLCLVCEQPDRLPATIRSRCQRLRVPAPPEAQALEWLRSRTDSTETATLLRLAHGTPLRAVALAEEGRLGQRAQAFAGFIAVASGSRDPIEEAAAWNEHEPPILLDWLAGWVSDLMRLATGHRAPLLVNQDKIGDLRPLAASLDPRAGHRYLLQILQARASEHSPVNRLLLCESLLVQWARIARGYKPEARRIG